MENLPESVNTFAELAAKCGRILKGIFDMISDFARANNPYFVANMEHPEWVHRAIYSKKKRIRKKYHDRIMRTYGG